MQCEARQLCHAQLTKIVHNAQFLAQRLLRLIARVARWKRVLSEEPVLKSICSPDVPLKISLLQGLGIQPGPKQWTKEACRHSTWGVTAWPSSLNHYSNVEQASHLIITCCRRPVGCLGSALMEAVLVVELTMPVRLQKRTRRSPTS